MDIRLFSVGETRELIASATTNDDGRTPYPLLEDDLMKSGTYELEFDIGRYFQIRGSELADPPFLDTVVIRFAVAGDR